MRWLGSFPIGSGPKHQDATHFWMPAHDMIYVPRGTFAPWEADGVKVPRKAVRYKAPQSTHTRTHTLSRGSQTHSGPHTANVPRLLHAHTHAGRQGPRARASASSPPRAEAAWRGCAKSGGGGGGGGGAAKQPDAACGRRDWSARPEGRLRRPGEGLGAGPRLEPAPWHTGAHAPRSAVPESGWRRASRGEEGTPAAEGGRQNPSAYQTPRPSCRIF